MNSWFECKVKYDKEIEGGMQKTVSEPYMVDALSFTEAESRILEEMRPFISGEFTVANIKRVKISELFFDESGDRWYKCKVNFITLDEKSGVEKRTASYMMVQAADFKTALENLLKGMKGTMADYEIASITETLIMDVFRYDADSVPAAPGHSPPGCLWWRYRNSIPPKPFGRHTMRDNVFSEKAGFKSWSLSRPYSPPISNGTLSAICRPIK